MKLIYFIRHGQDDEEYIGGWSDVSLTEEGIEEIKKSSTWIQNNLNIKMIITSDILRATETAQIIGEKLNLDYLETDSLREQNKGDFNGLKKSLLSEEKLEFLKNVTIYTIFPNGESLMDLKVRIENIMEKILALDDDTLIVTHRGVINMIYIILNNLELTMDKERFDVTHGSIHELDKEKRLIRRIYQWKKELC
jgi:phosphoglycerate mutase